MNYETIGTRYKVDYAVFPYNLYTAKTTLPSPYYRYEPRGPGTFLVPPGTDVNPYGPPSQFGWMYYPNGYGEGNLIGHTCDCACGSIPSGYGPTNSCTQCWCGKGNKNLCSASPSGRCEAVDVSKVKLR